jgi:hypothetical protein
MLIDVKYNIAYMIFLHPPLLELYGGGFESCCKPNFEEFI